MEKTTKFEGVRLTPTGDWLSYPERPIGLRSFLPVNTDHQILVGIFDEFSWIRCVGKGSFLLSPLMKQFADERIESGETCIAVDLAACTGMDSTFMGSLAGMATRLMAVGGSLKIAEIDARGIQSLEDLGLDCLMEIRPISAPWIGRVDGVRAALEPPRSHAVLPAVRDRAMHVLNAHETLANTHDENARRFANVISVLRDQVGGHEDAHAP